MGQFSLLLILGQLATCVLAHPLPLLLRRQGLNNLSIPMQEIGSSSSRPNDPHFCCQVGADTDGVLQVYCQYDWAPLGPDYGGGGDGEDHSYDFDHPYHPKAEKWDIPQPVWLECNFSRKHKRAKLEPRHKKAPDRDGDADEWGMPEGGRDYAGHPVDPARTVTMGWPAPLGAHYKRLKRSLAASIGAFRGSIHSSYAPHPNPIPPYRGNSLPSSEVPDEPDDKATRPFSASSSDPIPPQAVYHNHTIHCRRDQPSPGSPYHLAPIPPANMTPYDLDPHHESHHSSDEDSEDDTRPFPLPEDRPHRKHYPMTGGEMPEDANIIQIGPGGPPPEVVRTDGKKVIFPWDTNADIPSLEHGPYDRVKRHEKLPPDPPGITGDPLLIDEEDIPGLNEFEEEKLELLRHNSELSTMPAWGGEANYEHNDRLVRREIDWATLATSALAPTIKDKIDEHEQKESAKTAALGALISIAAPKRKEARDENGTAPSTVAVTAAAATDKLADTSPASKEVIPLVIVSDLQTIQTSKATVSSSLASSTGSASPKKSGEPESPSFIHKILPRWRVRPPEECAEEEYDRRFHVYWLMNNPPLHWRTPCSSSSSSSSSSATTTTTTAYATTITATTTSSYSSPALTSQPSAQATLRLAPRIAQHPYSYPNQKPVYAIITVATPAATTALSPPPPPPPPPPASNIIVTVTATATATATLTPPTQTTTATETATTTIISSIPAETNWAEVTQPQIDQANANTAEKPTSFFKQGLDKVFELGKVVLDDLLTPNSLLPLPFLGDR